MISRRYRQKNRTGSMMVMVLVIIIALLFAGAFAINKSYLNVAQTDLKTAVDLAAKSGAVALGQYQNQDHAREVAEQTFYRHQPVVGGDNDKLVLVDIKFGNAREQFDGSIDFVEDGIPVNAIQVQGAYPRLWNGDILPLGFVGNSNVQVAVSSIACRTDNDVCLVIDRSASMAWDMSHQEFTYPDGGSELQNYFSPPHATDSRWAALGRSVERFVTLAKTEIPGEVRMAMISYSSDYEFGIHESEQVTVDQTITASLSKISEKLLEYGEDCIIGDTDIAAGLAAVPQAYQSAEVRSETGNRVVILFTDGLVTSGSDPVAEAEKLYNAGYTVNVISFSNQADQALARDIAEVGGGMHWHADDENELNEAFKNIAESLPGTLIL